MVSVRVAVCFGIVFITLVHWSASYPTVDKESLQNELEPRLGSGVYKARVRQDWSSIGPILGVSKANIKGVGNQYCIKMYPVINLPAYDDNGPENSILLYKLLRRLGSQMSLGDLQRKRSYWKQCAFNAVACYGK